MIARSLLLFSGSACLALTLACGGDSAVAPNGAALSPGDATEHAGPQTLTVQGGAGGSDYVAVLVNTSLTTGTTESFTLQGTGVIAPTASVAAIIGSSASRASEGTAAAAAVPARDEQFELGMRARERVELTPRIGAAREWYRARTALANISSGSSAPGAFGLVRRDGALPAGVQVGDILTVNVNG